MLRDYVETFIATRDLSTMYAKMLRHHVMHFDAFSGGNIRVAAIDCTLVNQWLAHLRNTKLSPFTVCTYRRNFLAVWRSAYLDGLSNNPPLRVRPVKKPARIIEAYTLAEINRLLHAAAQLSGRHVNGNRRSDFWLGFLHAAYSTGQRRGDLLLVRKDQIRDDGSATLVQHKTSKIVTVWFSPEARHYIGRLHCPNGLALPWPYRKDSLVPRFNKLRELAGVKRGSLKWIRRSAGSYAERDRPGDGPRLLGNTPVAFRQSYEAPEITQARPIQPPPLS